MTLNGDRGGGARLGRLSFPAAKKCILPLDGHGTRIIIDIIGQQIVQALSETRDQARGLTSRRELSAFGRSHGAATAGAPYPAPARPPGRPGAGAQDKWVFLEIRLE